MMRGPWVKLAIVSMAGIVLSFVILMGIGSFGYNGMNMGYGSNYNNMNMYGMPMNGMYMPNNMNGNMNMYGNMNIQGGMNMQGGMGRMSGMMNGMMGGMGMKGGMGMMNGMMGGM